MACLLAHWQSCFDKSGHLHPKIRKPILDGLIKDYEFLNPKGSRPLWNDILDGNFFHDDIDGGIVCQSPKKEVYHEFIGRCPCVLIWSSTMMSVHFLHWQRVTILNQTRNSMLQAFRSIGLSLDIHSGWAVSLGHFDACAAVMTMLSFGAMPREEHLDCVKCIIGFSLKMW